jgi:hypothetical protein
MRKQHGVDEWHNRKGALGLLLFQRRGLIGWKIKEYGQFIRHQAILLALFVHISLLVFSYVAIIARLNNHPAIQQTHGKQKPRDKRRFLVYYRVHAG